MRKADHVWPKQPQALTERQERNREDFMLAWHETLPRNYAFVEDFNQGYIAKLGVKRGTRTLEIGAGLGAHFAFEDLTTQDYYAIEVREEFCKRLEPYLQPGHAILGSIEERQPFPDGAFDRVIAIHVLEHLRNLPRALEEVLRLLRPGGVFDVVLPTEGGFAYELARKISAERLYRKLFHEDYTPIIRNEHVNTYGEVVTLLLGAFTVQNKRYFPGVLPGAELNVCAGFRLCRR